MLPLDGRSCPSSATLLGVSLALGVDCDAADVNVTIPAGALDAATTHHAYVFRLAFASRAGRRYKP